MNSSTMDYSTVDCSTGLENESSVTGFINQTDPDYLDYRISYITILLTLGLFGILLNSLLLIYMYCKSKHQNFALRSLILQLSIANLMVAIFCLLADGIWNITVQWYGGDFLCRLIKYLQMMSLYAATLILTGMSIEACVTVTFPLTKSYRPVTLIRARIITIFCWSLAAFCSIPQAVIFHTAKAPICEEFYQCVTHGFYVSTTQELVYTMATLCRRIGSHSFAYISFILLISSLMCVVPLVVIIVCYVIIFIKMSTEAQIASGKAAAAMALLRPTGEPTRGKRIYARTRQQFLWMTFVSALTFIICWVPYYFAMFGHLFQWTISHETLSAIFCFGMSSAAINPIIFGGFLLFGTAERRDEMLQLRGKSRYSLSPECDTTTKPVDCQD